MSMNFESFLNFLIRNKWILLFYISIFLLVYLNRKKFEIQAKIIAMYRTKFGISTIHKFAGKHSELIKIIGYIGIGIGFIGLITISVFILVSLWNLFFMPNAPPAITPVIPGVKIPGSPIFVPFWYGIISLFIVVVVHEFSHGIVAAAHGLKVKNTGIVFFGPLIGAFVEPDEKEIKKKPDVVQYSIFAAGPFSNIILGAIALLLMTFIFLPIHGTLSNDIGVSFESVQNATPAMKAGLYPNMTIIQADSTEIKDMQDFETFLLSVKPNETVTIHSAKNESFSVTTTTHPDNPKKGYLGVIGVHTETKLKNSSMIFKITDTLTLIIAKLLLWVYILSLGIGLANLLPIGPVDGGRMLQIASQKTSGNKKLGNNIWQKITLLTIVILLILLIVPILRSVLKF